MQELFGHEVFFSSGTFAVYLGLSKVLIYNDKNTFDRNRFIDFYDRHFSAFQHFKPDAP